MVCEEHFLFLSKLFLNIFQAWNSMRWLENWWFAAKRNPSILSSSEKTVEIPENEAAIVPNINNHVAAGYDRTVSIGKVLEIDDSDAKISFYGHAETLSIGSIFRKPKKRDEIWVDFVNILCGVQVPAETNRGTKLKSLC